MKSLKPHQTLALDCMNSVTNMGIFFDPGTGKTVIALTWLRDALRDGRIDDALVVVPAALVPNWQKDISELVQFEHFTEDDVKLIQEKVTIRSYQKLYRTWKDEKIGRKRMALREDVDKRWGAIIVDESHGLGGHSSIQTKACLALAPLAKYRYIMTGTPISGGTKSGGEALDKLYGQFKFLDPNIWGTWTQWCKKYVLSFDRFFKPQRFDVDALHRIMAEKAISIRLEDCVPLPEEIRTTVPCPLEEKKVYADIRKGKTVPYEFEIKTSGGAWGKLRQVCSGMLKTDTETKRYKTSKDAALEELLTGTDDKVVIFCWFTASVDRCCEIAKKVGRNPVIFDGRSKGPTWREFTEGDKDVVIAQYGSGGPGLNLQVSSTMILFEPCLSTLLLKQSFARIKRIGQERAYRYIMLSTPGTVESKIWEDVLNGKDVTDATFDRWAQEGSI